MIDYIVPLILLLATAFALRKKENAYNLLLTGGAEGLQLLITLVPALVMLLTAVSMLRASGAMEVLGNWLSPVFSFFGIPPETALLVLVRPISGSAALGVGAELIQSYGPDSYLGRVAAVMLGSTETTFYTIAVYFGSVGVSRTRYAIPAALCADLTGFLAAAWAVRLCFGTV